jgi:hypothetical protein
MPVGPLHDLEHLADEVDRNGFMKQVTHAVDEDAARLLPPKGQRQLIRM